MCPVHDHKTLPSRMIQCNGACLYLRREQCSFGEVVSIRRVQPAYVLCVDHRVKGVRCLNGPLLLACRTSGLHISARAVFMEEHVTFKRFAYPQRYRAINGLSKVSRATILG